MSKTSPTIEILDVVSQVLIRCVVMGVLVLLLWWGGLAFMGDLTYSVHSKLTPHSQRTIQRHSLHWNAFHQGGGITFISFPIYRDQTCDQEEKTASFESINTLYFL